MHTVAALALASGLAAGDGPVDFPPNPIEKPGWILTVNDEFDGPALNTDLCSQATASRSGHSGRAASPGRTPKLISLNKPATLNRAGHVEPVLAG